MNKKQEKVLIIAAILIGLMLLYPPYKVYGYGINSSGIIDSGYDLIINLPDRAVIDVLALLIQWIGVILVGFILFYIYKYK